MAFADSLTDVVLADAISIPPRPPIKKLKEGKGSIKNYLRVLHDPR